ncbi:MAG: hypothetical protein GXX78_05300 [Bacteroidales bacterium]|nr:hypothetical protein [Bacteroidales bacterium]
MESEFFAIVANAPSSFFRFSHK